MFTQVDVCILVYFMKRGAIVKLEQLITINSDKTQTQTFLDKILSDWSSPFREDLELQTLLLISFFQNIFVCLQMWSEACKSPRGCVCVWLARIVFFFFRNRAR